VQTGIKVKHFPKTITFFYKQATHADETEFHYFLKSALLRSALIMPLLWSTPSLPSDTLCKQN